MISYIQCRQTWEVDYLSILLHMPSSYLASQPMNIESQIKATGQIPRFLGH
jgi:hypothetical protein